MTKLTATQLTILAAAAARDDGLAVRPDTLKSAGAAKLVAKLLELGLVRELRAKGHMPVWRDDEHGKPFSLRILKAGRSAVQALAPRAAESQGAAAASKNGVQADGASAGTIAQPMQVTDALVAKPGSKRALILALLARADGATIQALMEATGWLPHTTRAALSGLRKGGLAIARSRDDEGGVSVYRIDRATVAAAA